MAFTFSTTEEGAFGDLAYWAGTWTAPNPYVNDGVVFAASDVGLKDVLYLSITPDTLTSTTGLYPVWDKANLKIQFMEAGANGSPHDEIGTDNISALVLYVLAIGTSAAV